MHAEPARILIVDDEKTYLDVLVGLLQDEYKTSVAKNGEQALKRAQTTPQPNLILLDILMPGIDGLEVCRLLKANPATAEIPIIFITGKDAPTDETKGLAVGAVDFIRKPFIPAVALARIQTQLSLQRQKIHLRELNELKNKFIGMAAHDLRNPLNTICGYSDILLTMNLEESERLSFTKTIFDVSKQMLDMINDLLDVNMIESGHFVLKLSPNDLTDLVKERVAMMAFTAEKKGIRINTDWQPTPLTSFDHDRMAQVVDNLLSNAIKFTQPHREITVRTGQQPDQGRIFFQVMDQGPGIPDSERERLFGAFQKLSVKPTAQERSTGLGLSIVKKIMDAHHGEITVANNSDLGATFTCLI